MACRPACRLHVRLHAAHCVVQAGRLQTARQEGRLSNALNVPSESKEERAFLDSNAQKQANKQKQTQAGRQAGRQASCVSAFCALRLAAR